MSGETNLTGPGAGRSVLITGCSSGIGLECARVLRDRGWRVFASCRKEEDCARLRGEGFLSPRIDYQDEASIEAGYAETLAATGGRLDALFNNGAFASPGALEDLPTEALRAIFEANYFGWHTLTRLALKTMRAQGGGRIVQCSSVLGFMALKFRGAYISTKYALEGHTDTLRLELEGSDIHAILIQPGPISTMFRQNAYPHFKRWITWEGSPHADIYPEVDARLSAAAVKKNTFELEPDAVARKLIHALEAKRPRPRYPVTTATYLMAFLKRVTTTRAYDRLLSGQSY